ncbi:MAG: hypothetical protein JJW00_08510 [Sulfurimonas sp.]|nr:hypothetical protein [Sulfurimonas sp.]
MKNIILILSMMLMFSGCLSSSLKLDKNDNLVLKYNSKNLELANSVKERKSLNFKDLFVTIYKLQNKQGRVLFYEEAQTDESFEFNYGGLYTLMYVFDDRLEYEEVYKRNNLRLVQLKLKNSSYLNVMIQDGDTQSYTFSYGFSNKEFLSIAKKIKVKEEEKIKKLKYEAITFSESSKPLSNWNDILIFFTPLIVPFRGTFMR